MPRKKSLTPKQIASLEWFKEVVKKVTNKTVAENYDKSRKRISESEILTFAYPNPKTELKQLKWFDAHPLVLLFNVKGKNMYGLNLHYLPTPAREILLKKVIGINKLKLKANLRFDLSWELINEFIKRNGWEFIIKQYIPARMQNVQYIPYNQWKYAINVPSEKFVFDGQYSMDDIQALVRRSIKKTKQAKNVRYGRAIK